MARLNGIQTAIANHPSHSLLDLEKVLHKELNTFLDQEEELWVQKSSINRLIEGDRNTTFHHLSTIVRRRRNKISCIKNDMGEWILSENGAMNHIRKGFESCSQLVLNLLLSTPCGLNGGLIAFLMRRDPAWVVWLRMLKLKIAFGL